MNDIYNNIIYMLCFVFIHLYILHTNHDIIYCHEVNILYVMNIILWPIGDMCHEQRRLKYIKLACKVALVEKGICALFLVQG